MTDATYDMRFATSDDGLTWNVTPLPRDGTHATSWFQSISVGSSGSIAIGAYFSGAAAPTTCGGPKILNGSADGGFTVTCPDNATIPAFAGRDTNIRHGLDNKLVMAFTYDDANNAKLTRGIVVWHQP